ncbi:SCL-interrupting locus protein-like [Hondaea fermentalgiana]|uniref:SCL-interrupting locus protein-like n=1 Tax=Hondaea fermentalgiana TaxID=2315210 RepID=A0A2R5GCX6_9STRA|nr:SCL-interrupting locus protein-like [Hondaea fermentalgiana]|eukprot:GBG27558.1 SCL-interrupting locus protein-like [Hondaea fermentalgiana]
MEFAWGVVVGTILGVLLMQAISWMMAKRGDSTDAGRQAKEADDKYVEAGATAKSSASENGDQSEASASKNTSHLPNFGNVDAVPPSPTNMGTGSRAATSSRGRSVSSSVRSPSMSSIDSWNPHGARKSNGNGPVAGVLNSGASGVGSEEPGDEEYEEESEGRLSQGPVVDTEKPPPDAPLFPFIRIRNLMEQAEPKHFYPNLRSGPQEFQNENASGKTVLALRAKECEDPAFAAYFSGKQRRFQLKFQITLSKTPRGPLYLGGKVPGDMQLGMVTKGLCRGILSILRKVSSGMHYSFGKHLDSKDGHKELPHIAFPVFIGATALQVTKAGEEVPNIEDEIIETPEQVKARKKNGQGMLHAGDTITFEVHSMYIDVIEWKVTNLGALGNIDLSLFWDTMPLHLVLYDVPENAKHHYEDEKRSYFGITIENTWYAREKDEPSIILPESREDVGASASGADATSEVGPAELRKRSAKVPLSRVNSVGLYVGSEDGGDGDHDLMYEDEEESGSRDSRDSNADEEISVQRTASGTEPRSLTTRDLIVLAWIEHAGSKRKSISFVLSRSDGSLLFLQQREHFAKLDQFAKYCEADLSKKPRKTWEWESLREQLDKTLAAAPATRVAPSWLRSRHRLLAASRCEDLHVSVSSKYTDGSKFFSLWEGPVLRPLWETKWNEEWAVLVRGKAKGDVYLLLFACNSKSPAVVLSASRVLEVRAVSSATLVPFATYFPCLEIHTKGRVIMLGLPSPEKRVAFQDILADAAQRERRDDGGSGSSSDDADSLLTSDMTTDSLNVESSRWGSQKRMIINCRRLHFNNDFSRRLSYSEAGDEANANGASASSGCFRSGNVTDVDSAGPAAWSGRRYSEFGTNGAVSARPHGRLASIESSNNVSTVYEQDLLDARTHLEQKWPMKPWELSSILLRTALSLHDSSSLEDQIRFFDQASQLRELNIYGWSRVMTHEETTCFALNLYHALRLHAKYLVGQPSSLLGWASFGSRVSYAIGAGPSGQAMVLSLAEIEHCILRKPMSLARTMVSTSYPTSRFTRLLELRTPEPRINLVINYGTKCTSSKIVVFNSPSQLDKLLDVAAADFLREHLKIETAKHIIGLPKLVYWYGKDFAANKSMRDYSTKSIGLEVIEYCAEDQRQLVDRVLRHPEGTFRTMRYESSHKNLNFAMLGWAGADRLESQAHAVRDWGLDLGLQPAEQGHRGWDGAQEDESAELASHAEMEKLGNDVMMWDEPESMAPTRVEDRVHGFQQLDPNTSRSSTRSKRSLRKGSARKTPLGDSCILGAEAHVPTLRFRRATLASLYNDAAAKTDYFGSLDSRRRREIIALTRGFPMQEDTPTLAGYAGRTLDYGPVGDWVGGAWEATIQSFHATPRARKADEMRIFCAYKRALDEEMAEAHKQVSSGGFQHAFEANTDRSLGEGASFTTDEYTGMIRKAVEKFRTKGPADPVQYLDGYAVCKALPGNRLAMRVEVILPSISLEFTPITPLSILGTPLARQLDQWASAGTKMSTQVDPSDPTACGFVTLNQTRKAVFLLEDDPMAYELPLVGIWLRSAAASDLGRHQTADWQTMLNGPFLWSVCLRYIHNDRIKEKVSPPEAPSTFLVVVYPPGSPLPQFLECSYSMFQDKEALSKVGVESRPFLQLETAFEVDVSMMGSPQSGQRGDAVDAKFYHVDALSRRRCFQDAFDEIAGRWRNDEEQAAQEVRDFHDITSTSTSTIVIIVNGITPGEVMRRHVHLRHHTRRRRHRHLPTRPQAWRHEIFDDANSHSNSEEKSQLSLDMFPLCISGPTLETMGRKILGLQKLMEEQIRINSLSRAQTISLAAETEKSDPNPKPETAISKEENTARVSASNLEKSNQDLGESATAVYLAGLQQYDEDDEEEDGEDDEDEVEEEGEKSESITKEKDDGNTSGPKDTNREMSSSEAKEGKAPDSTSEEKHRSGGESRDTRLGPAATAAASASMSARREAASKEEGVFSVQEPPSVASSSGIGSTMLRIPSNSTDSASEPPSIIREDPDAEDPQVSATQSRARPYQGGPMDQASISNIYAEMDTEFGIPQIREVAFSGGSRRRRLDTGHSESSRQSNRGANGVLHAADEDEEDEDDDDEWLAAVEAKYLKQARESGRT